LKDDILEKINRQKRYASDLDTQVSNFPKNKVKLDFMTGHEKKLNSDNLQGWKNHDAKLYSAVPGWGSNVEYTYQDDCSHNKNLFQKISKRAQAQPLANHQNRNSSCQMTDL
jgi:hypothetical protein